MSRTTYKTKFTQNAEFVGDIHYFGYDRRGLWQHHADMRNQIQEMFSAHYGEDFNKQTEKVEKKEVVLGNDKVNWKHLGQQLKTKCNIID